MAIRRTPFAVDEWYHCFNRGVDKRTTYRDEADYNRFLELLFLTNDTAPFKRENFSVESLEEVVRVQRYEPLVAIGAFCLMPNHFHLLLREIIEGGITTFMHKLGTAYTMYFNARNERTGNLFCKPFRSRHVHNDQYLQYLVQYIHSNPAELYEPKWKSGEVGNMDRLVKKLTTFPYSSMEAYDNANVPTRPILDESVFDVVRKVSSKHMLADAAYYYAEYPQDDAFC